jgi:hypothetical protein
VLAGGLRLRHRGAALAELQLQAVDGGQGHGVGVRVLARGRGRARDPLGLAVGLALGGTRLVDGRAVALRGFPATAQGLGFDAVLAGDAAHATTGGDQGRPAPSAITEKTTPPLAHRLLPQLDRLCIAHRASIASASHGNASTNSPTVAA